MKILLLIACLIASLIIPYAESANILCLMGMPSKSHHIWNRPLMVALAEQGHNVTALSVDVDVEKTPNLHYIQIEGVYEDIAVFYKTADMASLAKNNPFTSIALVHEWYIWICSILMQKQGVNVLNDYPKDFKFDVVIHDFTCAQCLLGFVHKFKNPPLISMSAFNIPSYTTFISGNPMYPAYVPLMPLSYSSDMTFFQRTLNLICHGYDRFYRYFLHMPVINKIASEYFGKDLPDLTLIEQSTSITFVNTDPSIDIAQPLLPSVVAVGGLHIQPPKMNKKLGKILDILNDKKGVIFFSLGSNMRSNLMTADRIQMFLDAFSMFPLYNILWKYESDNLKNVPKNIFIQNWMPQNEILSSSSVKLFITHGGMLSTQEAVYYGVPTLGMPFFVDQHQNLHKSILAGVAEKLDYNHLTKDEIVEKMKLILNSPSYTTNVKRRQEAFRNQQNTPMEKALFWVNYVVQNGGAPHLKTVLSEMPLWKLLMLDIIALFIGIIFISIFIVKKLISMLFKSKYVKLATKEKKN